MTGKIMKNRRKELGLSADYLAERLGVSRATIFRYENGDIEKIPSDILKPLSEILGLSPSQLMGWSVIEAAVSPTQQVQSGIRIPVLGRIPAGIPIEAIEEINDYEEIPAAWARGDKKYFALRVEGNSMFPKYLENDIVIFRQSPDCDSGAECAVVVNGNDATFKKVIRQLTGIVLQPLNTNFEPIFYSNDDIERLPVQIIGIATEIRRKP